MNFVRDNECYFCGADTETKVKMGAGFTACCNSCQKPYIEGARRQEIVVIQNLKDKFKKAAISQEIIDLIK